MATVVREVATRARPRFAWEAIADVGALHTRLVPGFVVATRLEPGARVVTFANGAIVREPIVTVDEATRRLVWSAEGGRTTHYNASLQVLGGNAGAPSSGSPTSCPIRRRAPSRRRWTSAWRR